MENLVDILHKIREIQHRSSALRQLSKEIHDETTTKIKELQEYSERNVSSKAEILEQKRINSILEQNHHSLDQRIMVRESILKKNSEDLENLKKLLTREQNEIFSARSAYCDSVHNFLHQLTEDSPTLTFQTTQNSERKKLQEEIVILEYELKSLDENISEKDIAWINIQSMKEIQNQRESRCQKLLEEKKQVLKNLISQVKHLKFNLRKRELSHTIENLYHQNNENFSFELNPGHEMVSSYFIESDKKNFNSSKSFDKLYNFRTRHELCSDSSVKSQESVSISCNEDSRIKQNKISTQSDGNKNKFTPKKPKLSKTLQH